MVMSRSVGGMSAAIARSRVVLPAPMPPQMMHDLRARIAERRNSRSATSSVPFLMRSSGVTRR